MRFLWIHCLALAGLIFTVPGVQTPASATEGEASGVTDQALPVELGSPFADGAVLQRRMPVPIWGWSKPGATVTVAFAIQKKSKTSDRKGKWMVTRDPLKASAKQRDLQVTSSNETIAISGVLVGEVWFSSGQSNME